MCEPGAIEGSNEAHMAKRWCVRVDRIGLNDLRPLTTGLVNGARSVGGRDQRHVPARNIHTSQRPNGLSRVRCRFTSAAKAFFGCNRDPSHSDAVAITQKPNGYTRSDPTQDLTPPLSATVCPRLIRRCAMPCTSSTLDRPGRRTGLKIGAVRLIYATKEKRRCTN